MPGMLDVAGRVVLGDELRLAAHALALGGGDLGDGAHGAALVHALAGVRQMLAEAPGEVVGAPDVKDGALGVQDAVNGADGVSHGGAQWFPDLIGESQLSSGDEGLASAAVGGHAVEALNGRRALQRLVCLCPS